ncbi:hypothetical protein RCL_jg7349.t1 [Rhizophagus clarus]|uniref:Uncharacterized protein n=1 Tax=Rhizophagus clarus TaxID=94130 RepID=A0A8H3QGQ1_9GLOM|nr:hypothetical protein RCL_jg7349.t1 [Rhizophagus clarus]
MFRYTLNSVYIKSIQQRVQGINNLINLNVSTHKGPLNQMVGKNYYLRYSINLKDHYNATCRFCDKPYRESLSRSNVKTKVLSDTGNLFLNLSESVSKIKKIMGMLESTTNIFLLKRLCISSFKLTIVQVVAKINPKVKCESIQKSF